MKGHITLAALVLFALWAGMARAAPDHSLAGVGDASQQYVIVSVQPTPDAAAGAQEADTAKAVGFNSLRVIMPWSYPWQADAINDAARVCSVAAEAAKLGMTVFLDVVPTGQKPPTLSRQITKYDTTVGAYMSYLLGPKGCAQGLSGLVIEVANEANYSAFWPQATAPQEYTHLAIRTFKFVHQETQKQGYATPVRVMVGELAASHDPVGFMDQMRAEAQKWGYHGPFFDMFSYHCYGTGGQPLTSPDAVRTALAADFDAGGVPLLCTEYALPNATNQQYCQLASMAVTGGLRGFGWFRLIDDPSGSPTGLFYYDPALGQPGDHPVVKSPLQNVPAYNAAALAGRVSCG